MKGNNSMKVCLDENVLLDSQRTDVIGNLYMEVGKKTRAYGHDFGTF